MLSFLDINQPLLREAPYLLHVCAGNVYTLSDESQQHPNLNCIMLIEVARAPAGPQTVGHFK